MSCSSRNHDNSWEFSSKRCRAFFRHYASKRDPNPARTHPALGPTDPDLIGPDGIEKLCKDLNVKPEDIMVLALSWKLNAKEMGVYTVSEWLHGMTELK